MKNQVFKFILVCISLTLLAGITNPMAAQANKVDQNPVQALASTAATAVSARSSSHTCALTDTGGVKCWGANSSGQLGDGTTTQRSIPVDVVGLSSGVTAISTGYGHTCALISGGGVKCWGVNMDGQLGDGTTTQRSAPVDVIGLASGVTAIESGGSHSCAILSGGGVKCWGYNLFGELGDGTNIQRLTPVDVVGLSSGITAITSEVWHTCALTHTGGVKCWGMNQDGQLGDNSIIDRWTPVDVVGLSSGVAAISAGWRHSCALTDGGGIKCWGTNLYGQLGDDTKITHWTPVNVVGLSNGMAAVSAGVYHTCAMTSAGGIMCWGKNDTGQLGDNTNNEHLTPVNVVGLSTGMATLSAGMDHTCVLTVAGGIKCWGRNDIGQLGDNTKINRWTPVDVVGFDVNLYTLSGFVTLDGSGLVGVSVANSAGPTTITASDGRYTFSGLSSGSYTITPTLTGYTFTPPSQTLILNADMSGVNFVGTVPPGPDISLVGPISVWNNQYPFAANHLTFKVGVLQPVGSGGIRAQVGIFDGPPIAGGSLISSSVPLTLTPGLTVEAQMEYNLPGNIENHTLYARVSLLDGFVDPDPSNNSISVPFSAYFVDFSHDRDAYSFEQKSVGAFSISEIGEFFSSYQISEGDYLPMLPIIGLFFEVGGYCYGMADSSLAYYSYPNLRPNFPDTTFNLSLDQARARIRTYQWYSLIPFLTSVMETHYDTLSTFNDTVKNLKQGTPIMHGLIQRSNIFGGSHAVVAYKAVSLGNERRVFYTDSNFPLDIGEYSLKNLKIETFGEFSASGFSERVYKGLDPRKNYTEAHVMGVQLSRTDAVNVVRDFIRWVYRTLNQNGLFNVSFNGRQNFLAVDGQGRRSGIQNGQTLNEIPGAQLSQTDTGLSMILSTSASYQFQISSGTLSGFTSGVADSVFSLSIVDPNTDQNALMLEFQNVALPDGSEATATFVHGQTDLYLSLSDETNFAALITPLQAPPIQVYLPAINK